VAVADLRWCEAVAALEKDPGNEDKKAAVARAAAVLDGEKVALHNLQLQQQAGRPDLVATPLFTTISDARTNVTNSLRSKFSILDGSLDHVKNFKGGPPAFKWKEDKAETLHAEGRNGYLAYMEGILELPGKAKVFGPRGLPTDFLNVDVYDVRITGTTDLVVSTNHQDKAYDSTRQKLFFVQDVKKPDFDESKGVRQIFLELVASLARSDIPPLACLTDLGEYWYFLWCVGKEGEKVVLHEATCSRAKALGVLRAVSEDIKTYLGMARAQQLEHKFFLGRVSGEVAFASDEFADDGGEADRMRDVMSKDEYMRYKVRTLVANTFPDMRESIAAEQARDTARMMERLDLEASSSQSPASTSSTSLNSSVLGASASLSASPSET
jgi:hypothetical protein